MLTLSTNELLYRRKLQRQQQICDPGMPLQAECVLAAAAPTWTQALSTLTAAPVSAVYPPLSYSILLDPVVSIAVAAPLMRIVEINARSVFTHAQLLWGSHAMSVSPRDTDLTKDEDVNTSERGEQAEPSSDARDTGDCSRTATVGDRLQRGPDFADVAQSFRRCVIEGEWKRPDHDGDVMAVLRGLIQGTSESPGSSASADTGAVQARGQSDSLDLPVAKGAFTDASKAGGDFPSGAGIPAQSSPSARDSSSDDDASPVPVPTARRKRMARVVDSSSSSDECDCSDDGGGKDLVGARVHPAGRVSIGQSSSVGDRRSSCGSSVNGGNLADRLAAVRLSTSPAHSDDGGGGGWGGEATPSASVTLREAAPGSDSSEASIVIQKGSRLRRRVAVVDSSESEVDDQSVDGSPPTAASPAGKDPVGDEADGATDSLAERFAAIEIGEDEPKERGAAVLKKAPAPASRFLLSDSSDDDDEDLQSDAAGADATGSSGDDSWLVSDSEVQYEDGVEPDERDDAAYMPSYDSDDSDHSSDDSDYDSGKMRGGWDPALGSATTGGAATGGRAGKPPATPKSRPAAPPFTPIAVNGAQGARASAHTVLKPAQRGPMCSKFYKEFNSRVFEGSLPVRRLACGVDAVPT